MRLLLQTLPESSLPHPITHTHTPHRYACIYTPRSKHNHPFMQTQLYSRALAHRHMHTLTDTRLSCFLGHAPTGTKWAHFLVNRGPPVGATVRNSHCLELEVLGWPWTLPISLRQPMVPWVPFTLQTRAVSPPASKPNCWVQEPQAHHVFRSGQLQLCHDPSGPREPNSLSTLNHRPPPWPFPRSAAFNSGSTGSQALSDSNH